MEWPKEIDLIRKEKSDQVIELCDGLKENFLVLQLKKIG